MSYLQIRHYTPCFWVRRDKYLCFMYTFKSNNIVPKFIFLQPFGAHLSKIRQKFNMLSILFYYFVVFTLICCCSCCFVSREVHIYIFKQSPYLEMSWSGSIKIYSLSIWIVYPIQ